MARIFFNFLLKELTLPRRAFFPALSGSAWISLQLHFSDYVSCKLDLLVVVSKELQVAKR